MAYSAKIFTNFCTADSFFLEQTPERIEDVVVETPSGAKIDCEETTKKHVVDVDGHPQLTFIFKKAADKDGNAQRETLEVEIDEESYLIAQWHAEIKKDPSTGPDYPADHPAADAWDLFLGDIRHE